MIFYEWPFNSPILAPVLVSQIIASFSYTIAICLLSGENQTFSLLNFIELISKVYLITSLVNTSQMLIYPLKSTAIICVPSGDKLTVFNLFWNFKGYPISSCVFASQILTKRELPVMIRLPSGETITLEISDL